MTADNRHKCPGCAGTLHGIRLIDKAARNRHEELEYSLPEAVRDFWFGEFPVEGQVQAYMCAHCGRILLFGEPYEQS